MKTYLTDVVIARADGGAALAALAPGAGEVGAILAGRLTAADGD